jgi:hypothetical protein
MQRVRHANVTVPLIRKVPRWVFVTLLSLSPTSNGNDNNSDKPRLSPFHIFLQFAIVLPLEVMQYLVDTAWCHNPRPCMDLKQYWLPRPIYMQEGTMLLRNIT